MASFRIAGAVIPLGRRNVDTDLIIPSRYMKTAGRDGLGKGCFEALRADPANLFDDPRYRGAPILAAGANFGCGSSREHAVWALQQIGIEAILAPGFGEIFEANALRNGLVCVRLPEPAMAAILRLAPDQSVTVDLVAQQVIMPDGGALPFALDPFRKHCLVNGIDDLDVALALEDEISAYEARVRRDRPWLVPGPAAEEPQHDLPT